MEAAKQTTVNTISTNRIEALTDGIFAIVMTLLVLEISVPEITGSSAHIELTSGLAGLWPKILSYTVTFLMLGYMWTIHHRQFNMINRSDSVLVWLNIVFLMFVALMPFTTSMLGEYVGEQLPILIYCGNFLVCMIVRYVLWSYATGKNRLVDTDIDLNEVRAIKTFIRIGITLIVVAMGVSFLNIIASLAIISFCVISAIVRTMIYYRIRTKG